MKSLTRQTLSFFGATGGCANSALALALKDGYKASALARSPQKLRDMLENEHGVLAATLDSNLTIVKGSISDLAAIKETLAPKGVPASLIISGLGATPEFTWNPISPFRMDQPSICADGSAIILSALRELRRDGTISETQKPTICIVSTTGISKKRDVPYLLMPLYHIALKVPHVDKGVQEHNFAVATTETGAEAPIDNFVFIRPTLLMDGPSVGLEAVRSGWEKHDEAPNAVEGDAPGPVIGYTIRRADVGKWIFESVVKNVGEWKGKCVSLAY